MTTGLSRRQTIRVLAVGSLSILEIAAFAGCDWAQVVDTGVTQTATQPVEKVVTPEVIQQTPDVAEPPVSSAVAVAAVRDFDPAQLNKSISRLNEASFADAAAVAELAPFLADEDPVRRWAAVYLASLLVDDRGVDLLRPILDDPNVALRVIAAGPLSGLGVVESLPVLIEGLRSDAALPYTDPPRGVSDFARQALEAHTGQAFETQGQWEEWWDRVSGSIRWDGTRYVVG